MLKVRSLPWLAAALLPMQAMAIEFMSPEWANQACTAWSNDPVLTQQLAEIPEDDGQGYSWIRQ
ncbi:MAG: hypothetical protein R3E89_00635 [Thiolinea sp.]